MAEAGRPTRIGQKTTGLSSPMLVHSNRFHRGFTLVEIMIVVALIALLSAITVPNFLRARKRSQASRILEELRVIDAAVNLYATETNKSGGEAVTWTDLQPFLKAGSVAYTSNGTDLFGNTYGGYTVDSAPKLSSTTFNKLSDVAPSDFWSPFYP
jgi:prepilin-type N-terminal cleavage/methylation domain-containing protein